MIEAKRIRRSSFQPEQLAREYLAVVKEAGTRTPLLLLLLGSPPPLTVTGHGRLELAEAVTVSLEQLLARTGDVPAPIDELESQLPHVLAWITWEEVRGIVATQALEFNDAPNGLDGTVRRLSTAVATAIDWHS